MNGGLHLFALRPHCGHLDADDSSHKPKALYTGKSMCSIRRQPTCAGSRLGVVRESQRHKGQSGAQDRDGLGPLCRCPPISQPGDGWLLLDCIHEQPMSAQLPLLMTNFGEFHVSLFTAIARFGSSRMFFPTITVFFFAVMFGGLPDSIAASACPYCSTVGRLFHCP